MRKIAMGLYKWCCVHHWDIFRSGRVDHAIGVLHPGENRLQLITEYYVEKLARSLLIAIVAVILAVIVEIKTERNSRLGEDAVLVRKDWGEGATQLVLECELAEGKEIFQVELQERHLTQEEVQELYGRFRAELPKLIGGENVSLKQISKPLALLPKYEGYPFEVKWRIDNEMVIDSEGKISAPDQATAVELSADIEYLDWKWEEKVIVEVLPTVLTEQEILHRDLEEYLQESENESRGEMEWHLPDSWNGQSIRWKKNEWNGCGLLFVGGLSVSILIYFLADRDLQNEVEKRKREVKKAYPDIVHKLALYLGAGLSIRGALHRIMEDNCEGPAYEEIAYACRELGMGVSEAIVYEHFGKRIGLQEYVRLSTLLCQNLKKGSNTLLQSLREEAGRSIEERIQHGRKLGEEAATKLLLPMSMTLVVVMIIVMMPAFMSMGI